VIVVSITNYFRSISTRTACGITLSSSATYAETTRLPDCKPLPLQLSADRLPRRPQTRPCRPIHHY
jgi:hypothetical protein